MYDPRDALTDTVATLVFMPSKFDRSTMQLAEKINSATPDQETLNVSIYYVHSILHLFSKMRVSSNKGHNSMK